MVDPALQVLFYKLPHLPAPFADQADNVHLCLGMPRDHTEKHAFPDARSRKNPHPLSLPAGEKAVNAPHTQVKGLSNTPLFHRVGGGLINGDRFAAAQGPLPVDRVTKTVYDPA